MKKKKPRMEKEIFFGAIFISCSGELFIDFSLLYSSISREILASMERVLFNQN
jgi:hypothetical protein